MSTIFKKFKQKNGGLTFKTTFTFEKLFQENNEIIPTILTHQLHSYMCSRHESMQLTIPTFFRNLSNRYLGKNELPMSKRSLTNQLCPLQKIFRHESYGGTIYLEFTKFSLLNNSKETETDDNYRQNNYLKLGETISKQVNEGLLEWKLSKKEEDLQNQELLRKYTVSFCKARTCPDRFRNLKGIIKLQIKSIQIYIKKNRRT